MTQLRKDGRSRGDLRKISVHPNYTKNAASSVLIEVGETRVICAASLSNRVPPFLMNSGRGWITAEYSMLPSATNPRGSRESVRGRIGGRTHEIQRLIGRSLRAVADMRKLGERTITLDCDVIQADGGTRTASITGAFLALALLIEKLKTDGPLNKEDEVLTDFLAATSVGLLRGKPHLDLDYEEDSRADVDMNVVMTGSGKFVEIQGTAERAPFTLEEMAGSLDLAVQGITRLIAIQRKTLKGAAGV